MTELFLSCLSTKKGGIVEIKSPSVGRARMLVEQGQWVKSEQAVAGLTRMNQQFVLLLPKECEGSILDVKNRSYVVPLAYGEKFLAIVTLEQRKPASENSSEIIGSSSIDAPMDGMFYLRPSPDDAPFINIGDEISPGQTLGLIEVMKSFYPLVYQGKNRVKIVGINVKNASPIACGDKLIAVS